MGSFSLRQGPQQHRLAGISWRSTVLGLVLVVALLGAAPGAASAALGVSNGVLKYSARSGDANDIHVALSGADYTVTDSVAIDAAPSGGCIITGNTATCAASGVNSIVVNSGDLSDNIGIDASVTNPTQLFGRAGDDVLSGGSGSDVLNGYTGDDTLIGNDGADMADYSSSPAGAGVTVDLVAGSATGVGSDTITSTENVRGSNGDDTLKTRNGVGNLVFCSGGNDLAVTDPSDVVSGCEDNDDGVAPAVSISAGPDGITSNPRPSFEFDATDKDTFHFECSISGGGGASDPNCTSPHTPAANLDDGPHTFTATAIDKYGNAASVTRDFTVDATAPDTRFDSLPPEQVDTSTPSFAFSSDDPGATFACRFDTGDFFLCTSPVIPEPPLQNGDHSFEVIATDSAGNVDQTPALFKFTVNAPGPPPPPPPGGTTLQKGGSNVIVGSVVLISGRSAKLVNGRLVPVSLTCAGQRKCEGKITVTTDKPVRKARKVKKRRKAKARVERLGSTRYSIEGNHRARVMVPLSRSKVRLLKRLKRVKVRATIREIDLQGNPRVSTRTFILRAR